MLSRYYFPDEDVLYMFLQHWVKVRQFKGAVRFIRTPPLWSPSQPGRRLLLRASLRTTQSVYHLPGMGVPHSYHET